MSERGVLVAGIGNIFLGDDAFGVEVAKRLALKAFLPNVRVADYGVRGVDLAYELLEHYERIILVDVVRRGGVPGTIYLIEPEADESISMQTHEMTPAKVLSGAKAMGAKLTNVVLIGCEPESFGTDDEPQMQLSPVVENAVAEAVALIESLLTGERKAVHA